MRGLRLIGGFSLPIPPWLGLVVYAVYAASLSTAHLAPLQTQRLMHVMQEMRSARTLQRCATLALQRYGLDADCLE